MNQRETPTPTVAAPAPLPAPSAPPDPGAFSQMALSLALHAGVLLLSALAMPALGETPDSSSVAAEQFLLGASFADPAPPEEDAPVPEIVDSPDADGHSVVRSRCGEHGGSMGDPAVAATGHRYGVQGPADNADPHVSRDSAWGDTSWEVLRVGLPSGHWGGAADAPAAPWGRDDSLGTDPANARGEMWGDAIGAARGSPGAGIGLVRLCETCGANGRGRWFEGTRSAGATGTESAHAWGRPF